MTYKTDPFIPQQAESVTDLVAQMGTSTWGPQHQLRDDAGVWHRFAARRKGDKRPGFGTRCRLVVPIAHALTRIGGTPTCERCVR